MYTSMCEEPDSWQEEPYCLAQEISLVLYDDLGEWNQEWEWMGNLKGGDIFMHRS